MAVIFPVYGTTQAGRWGELPWLKCVTAFELDEFYRTEDRPKFGDEPSKSVFPTHVVIRVEEPEARQHDIQPGYFVSPLHGIDAKIRLDDALGRE